jgi:hypothetical protein
MRLSELAYVIGDDGGMHRQMDDAMKNMEHHSKNHKDEKVRELCTQAVSVIKGHAIRPQSLYDDPHTFLKILQNFKGEPNASRIKQSVNALSSYAQTDND